jgi:hypothetical protein
MSKQCNKCNKCNIIKQTDDYQFRNDTNKYRNECKSCCQTRINAYRRENVNYKKRYNEYRKNRRLQDIQFAMIDRLRARVRKMLNASNTSKYLSTIELLGCSMEIFQQHLISKFYGDMSWDKKNFVLDHIVPCSWFDLSNPHHQKICFNYKNIQPLTEGDNSKKSDKVWTTYNLMKNPYI